MEYQLYNIILRHKRTDEEISVQVWGMNEDRATDKIVSVLCGVYGEYEWVATEPVRNINNELVARRFY